MSRELETFLDAGDPPVYFGFCRFRVPENTSRVMIESARPLGRRAILLHGWTDLSLLDNEPDCIAIGEVNHQALFKQDTAIVHHGGAGTTHAATRAGAPQVVILQHYDQYYWASRVEQQGIGIAHTTAKPTSDSLTSALQQALQAEVTRCSPTIAAAVRSDGTRIASRRLINAA